MMKVKSQVSNLAKKRKIRQLYETGKYSMAEIGAMQTPPITSERVRQILNPMTFLYCSTHQRQYEKVCEYCVIGDYAKFLVTLDDYQLKSEVRRLKKQGRGGVDVIKRTYMIKHLIDNMGYEKSEVGRLLDRHRSSINHLYAKKI